MLAVAEAGNRFNSVNDMLLCPPGQISEFTVWIPLQWVYAEVAAPTLISLPGCSAEELALQRQGGENTLCTKACFGPKKRPQMS